MFIRSRNPACWISGANCLPAQPAARNRERTGYAFPQQKSGLLDFRRELSAGTAGRELSAGIAGRELSAGIAGREIP